MCAHCHCESCRRLHGAPLVSWTCVPEARFRLLSPDSTVHWYTSSPDVHWGSCKRCHSRLFNRARHHTNTRRASWYINVAALNPPHTLQPTEHVSIEEAVPWFPFDDALPRIVGKD